MINQPLATGKYKALCSLSPTAQRCVGDPRYTSRYPSHRDLNLEKRVEGKALPVVYWFLFVEKYPNPKEIYISYTYIIYI